MSEDATPRYGFPFLYAGQAQKEVYHNEALTLVDVLVQAQAVSAALTTPPSAPEDGACWIVADSPSGAWTGQAGKFACWTSGGWRFVAPKSGIRVWVEDEGLEYFHDGSEWTPGPLRPDGLYMSELRVVGDREAAIAAPTGGSTVDGEARTAILAILNALRNHGLIEESA